MKAAALFFFKETENMANAKNIDVVVPMVFPADPVWREKFERINRASGRSTEIDERVREWDIERFFFRGLDKFMPWVGTVHLILDGETQIPDWIDTSKVHIVYHEDIIPKDLLPTFNSQCIEMWLHNIEGLSEQFIYANDDMIALSPLKKTDFFKFGKPVIHCEEREYDNLIGIFRKVCRNALNLVANDAGVSFGKNVLLKDGHSYSPMLRSTLLEAVEKYGTQMRESCTTFRQGNNLIQYLYTYMLWLSGKRIDGHHPHKYFSLGTDLAKINKYIHSGEAGVCCFNDSGDGDWEKVSAFVHHELKQVFPEKSKYEK